MSRKQNAATIRRVLKSEGFSDIAIAGALGRLRAESSLDPNALRKNDAGPGKHSYGLLQWNRERFSGLKAFAQKAGRPWNDVETQARYFAAEAKGLNGEGKWGKKLLNAKNTTQAAQAAISMARPQGWSANNPSGGHGFKKQLAWTNEFAGGGGMDGLGTNDATATVAQVRTDPWMGSSNPAGKSRGRLDEEGEPFHARGPLNAIKQLDSMSELLFSAEQEQGDMFANPSTGTDGLDVEMAGNEQIDPIDNSFGAQAGQMAMGFLSLVGNQLLAAGGRQAQGGKHRAEILSDTGNAGGINKIQSILGGMKAGG